MLLYTSTAHNESLVNDQPVLKIKQAHFLPVGGNAKIVMLTHLLQKLIFHWWQSTELIICADDTHCNVAGLPNWYCPSDIFMGYTDFRNTKTWEKIKF